MFCVRWFLNLSDKLLTFHQMWTYCSAGKHDASKNNKKPGGSKQNNVDSNQCWWGFCSFTE